MQAIETRVSLIARLREADDGPAWNEFVEIYAPLIHAYARRRGLQDADAADLTQDVLHILMRRADDFRYDPERGSFRGWLFTVTLNRLRDLVDRRRRQIEGSGQTEMVELVRQVPDREDRDVWEQEHQLHLFRWAADRAKADFRETSWQAFWQTAIEQRAVKEVAAELDLSVGAVHIAKSRAMARIRDIIREVEGD
ncbi:MAG: sigma-70 family RNA polymerase sigma factor [Planctomycetota bacterium]